MRLRDVRRAHGKVFSQRRHVFARSAFAEAAREPANATSRVAGAAIFAAEAEGEGSGALRSDEPELVSVVGCCCEGPTRVGESE